MGLQQAMLGSQVSVVNLGTATIFSVSGLPASYYFNTDGSFSYDEDGITTVDNSQWLNPNPNSSEAPLYEIQRTQVSGTLGISFTGTLTSGTWYPLTSQRGVTATAGTVTRSNTSTYSIRRASDGVVLVSGISITVSADP